MSETFGDFLARCEALGLDAGLIQHAVKTLRPLWALLDRWYDSVERGFPDYGIYAEPIYLADMWLCWQGYSRRYLELVLRLALEPARIVDVGCGLGYSTVLLKQMFPNAEVFATNLRHTPQWDFAGRLAKEFNFTLVKHAGEIEHADLIFASEYFEHFEEPVRQLEDVLQLNPAALVIANSFNAQSLGHFDRYSIAGEMIASRRTGRAFNDALRIRGYEKKKTGWWNDRPSYWVKSTTKKK